MPQQMPDNSPALQEHSTLDGAAHVIDWCYAPRTLDTASTVGGPQKVLMECLASAAGGKLHRQNGGSSPKTSRAQLRSKLQEMKAFSSKQSHAESQEVDWAGPPCMMSVMMLAVVPVLATF